MFGVQRKGTEMARQMLYERVGNTYGKVGSGVGDFRRSSRKDLQEAECTLSLGGILETDENRQTGEAVASPFNFRSDEAKGNHPACYLPRSHTSR